VKRFDVASGIRTLHEQRGLLRSLVIRDLLARYRGTLLGFMWAIVLPLLMLAVYAFVFGGIFHARWGDRSGVVDFIPMLYCGLIVHGLFSETLTRAPGAILANPSYVKKVVFPLELLPVTYLASAAVNAVIGLALLAVLLVAQQHTISVTIFLTPLVFMPLILLSIGLAWFLAAIGVFFRDIGQIIGVVMTVLLFLSPVFYPSTSAPALAQKLILLNPLTYPIEELRRVFVMGVMPNWGTWLAYTGASSLAFLFGLWIFQRTRPAFADVV
jgi:lipopolysaccharide transport system permease protein